MDDSIVDSVFDDGDDSEAFSPARAMVSDDSDKISSPTHLINHCLRAESQAESKSNCSQSCNEESCSP